MVQSCPVACDPVLDFHFFLNNWNKNCCFSGFGCSFCGFPSHYMWGVKRLPWNFLFCCFWFQVQQLSHSHIWKITRITPDHKVCDLLIFVRHGPGDFSDAGIRYFFCCLMMLGWPGRASSVEENLICKMNFQGTQVRFSRWYECLKCSIK